MLELAIILLVISLIAGAFGFTNVAAGTRKAAMVIFGIFLVLALLLFLAIALGIGIAT